MQLCLVHSKISQFSFEMPFFVFWCYHHLSFFVDRLELFNYYQCSHLE